MWGQAVSLNRGLIKSTIFHIMVIISLFRYSVSLPKTAPKTASNSKAAGVVSPNQELYQFALVSDDSTLGRGKAKVGGTSKKKECKNEYVGIGIKYSELNHLVIKVLPGGPADKAGVQEYDVVVSDDSIITQGSPGSQFILSIERAGVGTLHLPIIREKICKDIK